MNHKEADLRYRIIDESIRNKQINCTMEVLIRRCSYHLTELRGKPSSISERTISYDLKALREGIKGKSAPIKCSNGTYYYEDEDFELFPDSNKIINEVSETLKSLERLNGEMHQTREYLLLLNKMSQISDLILPPNIKADIDKIFKTPVPNIKKNHELQEEYINNLISINESIKSRSKWYKKLEILQKAIMEDFNSM
ncbi:hypothetical protein [Seonamhaeicola sp. ML3]|uniref:hypothetical protein n=1 Tax=Seonamhaeicola sp. ML3 TaxID=2937786 RepID=UPI00200F0BBA|nr:hypothetical protein [Seonamhaeicola sp. ML3]